MLNILSCVIGGVNMSQREFIIFPKIIVMVINTIKIVVPIILIIFGMIDLAKAVMSNDEKEMKGAQSKLLKRVIYAVAIFLVVAIIQLVFGALAASSEGTDDAIDSSTIQGCISCFVNSTKHC